MEITFKKISFFILIAAAIVISSCKKETTSDVASWPVVVGYITPGQPISVKIYQQKDLTDTANYGALITGLQLSISDGSSSVKLTETATGTYTYSNLTFLKAGKTYTLQFTYNGIAVSASTLMPTKPVNYTASRTLVNLKLSYVNKLGTTDSVAIAFKWYNPDSLYHVLVFKSDDTDPFNIHPNIPSQINFTLSPKKADYYNVYFNSLHYIGTYKAILYSVNKEYIDAMVSNANSTSQKLTNPPTNVTNGFGIFTAMQSDTIALKFTQY